MGLSNSQEKYCICIISHKPNTNWLNFLQKQTQYDTFLVVDDNDLDYKKQYEECFPCVKLIQVDNLKCTQAGFSRLNYLIGKTVSGWDKAVYYFSCVNRSYDHVWFIEDDVFFNDEETLIEVDNQFPSKDLLSASCCLRRDTLSWVHWKKIQIDFKFPHYKSMVCAIRVSKQLLEVIKDYAEERGRLFFLEAFFPTIAKHSNLQCANPKALETIVYRWNWKADDLNKTQLFHPIKDMDLHPLHREQLRN